MRDGFLAILTCGLWSSCLAAMTFVHPGAMSSQAELDFVKAQIHRGNQPWKSEFEFLLKSDFAKRGPHGQRHVHSQNHDANVSRDDAIACYTQALLWHFTEDEVYARRSLAILNSWSQLESFNSKSGQDQLQAGWLGAIFASAAEIMRGYPDWSVPQIQRLQDMFRRAFYPQLNSASSWNGNVDLTQIEAILAIAVFNEDKIEFEMGIERFRRRAPAYFYLVADGPQPIGIVGDGGNIRNFWSHPVRWIDGLTQETCRDNGHHSQYGLGSALHAAEIAWHQGIDIYAEHEPRLTAAMELLALQLVTGSMQEVCRNDKSSTDFYDAWEVGYNHYHRRKGLSLPHTERLIREQIRPHAPKAVWNLIYETLTHADLPIPAESTLRPAL